ncbi:MAG: protoporphyrinogen oxidase [Planctomycetales bacterium]|nr:protoporphyrinogen oxidase [Planctomycetales bacterium]
MSRVAVLGGGISGLAAAVYLLQGREPVEVQVFDRDCRLGGVLETVRVGPYLVEKSADNFATLIPDALELSRLCGVDEQLVQPRQQGRQAFVLCRGKLQPIPLGFSLMQPTRVASILTTPTLSVAGKLRLLSEYFVQARTSCEDESLQSFATRRLGREAYENLVEPIVSGIFTADPTTLSMEATMPQFLEMERHSGGLIRGHLQARRRDAATAARKASGARYDQFRAPVDGMSSWVKAIAAHLPGDVLRLGTEVQRIVPASSGDSFGWQVVTSNSEELFDAVVCALPAAPAAAVLKAALPTAADILERIPYASSAVAAMAVNRRDLSGRIDGFGMISPSKEGRAALAISYTSNKYAGRAPDDEILLRIFLGGAMQPEILKNTDDFLMDVATAEVRGILGWSGSQANWSQIIRWNNAMPQYLVGHVQRIEQLEKTLLQFPTLRLCGAAYRGVGIPQCVRSGRQAAEQIRQVLFGS